MLRLFLTIVSMTFAACALPAPALASVGPSTTETRMPTPLDDFLQTAKSAGRNDVEVRRGCDGTVLLRATDPGADEVRSIIRGDADGFSSRREHAYHVVSLGPNGSTSIHTERVRGGLREEDDEHRVDPDKVGAAVVGHLTRLVADCVKELRSTCAVVRDMRKDDQAGMREELRDLSRTYRRHIAVNGEYELAKLKIEEERETSKAWDKRIDKGLDKVGGLLGGFMAGKGLLPPAAQASALGEVKRSLTPEQRVTIGRALGPDKAMAMMACETPQELADFLIDTLSQEEMSGLYATLDETQRDKLSAMCGPRMQERAKERAAAEAKATTPEGQGDG